MFALVGQIKTIKNISKTKKLRELVIERKVGEKLVLTSFIVVNEKVISELEKYEAGNKVECTFAILGNSYENRVINTLYLNKIIPLK
jgi:hypothetical protein